MKVAVREDLKAQANAKVHPDGGDAAPRLRKTVRHGKSYSLWCPKEAQARKAVRARKRLPYSSGCWGRGFLVFSFAANDYESTQL